MKATQETEVKVTGVTLNLTIEEAQVLKQISYMMLVKDGRLTLDMPAPAYTGEYTSFDDELHGAMCDALDGVLP